MKDKPITGAQLRALAEYVCTVRPDWDLRGVLANLAGLGEDVTTTTRKAITAATNPKANTPAAIGWAEAHPDDVERSGRPGSTANCEICGRNEWACAQAQTNTRQDPHSYRPGTRATLPPVQYVDVQFGLFNE